MVRRRALLPTSVGWLVLGTVLTPAFAQAPAALRPANSPGAPLVLKPLPAATVAPVRPATPREEVKQPGDPAPAVAKPPDLKTKSRKPKAAVVPAPLAPAPVLRATSETVPCQNPDALGTSRVVEVDTSQGLFVGLQYRTRLGLQPREVVLTFDDGPAPNTERALAALAKECVRATFFVVGRMAQAYPQTLRKTAEAGHTIGYHTMSHPFLFRRWPIEKSQDEVIRGWRTVDEILYGRSGDRPTVPFFRYPGLMDTQALNHWLVSIGVGAFSADATGNDWVRGYDARGVLQHSLKEIEAQNGGVLLLHDTKEATVEMLPQLLRELKARGFKVVHLVPAAPRTALKPLAPVQELQPAVLSAPPVSERVIGAYDLVAETAQRQRTIPPAAIQARAVAPAAAPQRAAETAESALVSESAGTARDAIRPGPAVQPTVRQTRASVVGGFLESVGLR